MPTAKRKARHSAHRSVVWMGERFDSQRELARWRELLLLERAGEIRDLERQVRIPIVIGGVEVRYPPTATGARGKAMVYVADFTYHDNRDGARVVEDAKMQSGYRPEVYRFKRALLYSMGVTIREV